MCVPGLAQAAGFDCGGTRKPRELLVCGDDGLSAADKNMNEAYTTALARLSPKGAELLRQSQRGWLHYVDAYCPMAADPAEHARAISCVAQAYANRMDDLQFAARQIGPFLFSRIDQYGVSVLAMQADQHHAVLARHHVAYPRIDQPATELTARWNALVVHKDELSGCDAGDGDTFTDYSFGMVTPNLIGVTWTMSDYCHGTPHGFGRTETQTLVLSPQPHPLTPADLFRPDAPWAEHLTMLLLAGVQEAAQNAQVALDDVAKAHIAEVARDQQRWLLDKDGIGFQFDPYEIGSYIFQPRVVVLWNNLRDVMVANAPVP